MNSVYHLEDSQEHIHNHQVLEKEEIILMHSDIDIYGVKWVLINELKHDTLIESKKELTESLLLFLAIVIIIVFIVSRYIALKILKPLSKLAQASKEYVTGSRKTILNDSDDKEIYELTVSFNTMLVVLSENEKLLNNYTLELEDKIAKEIEKNTIHQQALFKQTRLAQMGEMISMIAHQWRQPLGAITATDIDLKIKIELGIYDLKKEEDRKLFEAYFLEGLDNIENLAQGLTTTIDDFKTFINRIKFLILLRLVYL